MMAHKTYTTEDEGLLAFPNEILEYVLQFVDPKGLREFSLVSKRCMEIANNDHLWHVDKSLFEGIQLSAKRKYEQQLYWKKAPYIRVAKHDMIVDKKADTYVWARVNKPILCYTEPDALIRSRAQAALFLKDGEPAAAMCVRGIEHAYRLTGCNTTDDYSMKKPHVDLVQVSPSEYHVFRVSNTRPFNGAILCEAVPELTQRDAELMLSHSALDGAPLLCMVKAGQPFVALIQHADGFARHSMKIYTVKDIPVIVGIHDSPQIEHTLTHYNNTIEFLDKHHLWQEYPALYSCMNRFLGAEPDYS